MTFAKISGRYSNRRDSYIGSFLTNGYGWQKAPSLPTVSRVPSSCGTWALTLSAVPAKAKAEHVPAVSSAGDPGLAYGGTHYKW